MNWQKEMEKRARTIVSIIADIQNGVKDTKLAFMMTEGHFQDLAEIYSKEMRVAKILDESTITVEMRGNSIDPRYYAKHIINYYNKLAVNSKNICSELLHNKNIEKPSFEVMDYARERELYLGFKPINDACYQDSLLLFSQAAYNFEEEHEDAESTFESLQEKIDPALAHAVLASLTNLGPTKGSISEVKISGMNGKESGLLTFKRQRILRNWVKGDIAETSTPITSKRTIPLEGKVREINWEAGTFHILCDGKMIKIIPPQEMKLKGIGNEDCFKVTARRVYRSKDGTPSLVYADGVQNLRTGQTFGQGILF